MLHAAFLGSIHHVERAHNIRIDVVARLLDGVTHPGLPGQMDDHIRFEVQNGRNENVFVFQKPFAARKRRTGIKLRIAIFLQLDVIIIGHAVEAVNFQALLKQQFCEVETDKACCAGNKYALQQGCPSLMTVLRRDSVMPFLHPMGNHSECYGPCFASIVNACAYPVRFYPAISRNPIRRIILLKYGQSE